jgi:Asp-tRNA(Asn)/Glu-tRNA(Gln) amidotransferase A subunit family amidase
MDNTGLPLAVQLVGRAGEDHVPIAAANRIQMPR